MLDYQVNAQGFTCLLSLSRPYGVVMLLWRALQTFSWKFNKRYSNLIADSLCFNPLSISFFFLCHKSPLSSSWTPGWLACWVSTPRPDLSSFRPCGSTSRPTNSKTLMSASSSTVTNTCNRWVESFCNLAHLQIYNIPFKMHQKKPHRSWDLMNTNCSWCMKLKWPTVT